MQVSEERDIALRKLEQFKTEELKNRLDKERKIAELKNQL